MKRKPVAKVTVDVRIAERFVRENWLALAAAAWRYHLRHGLGALIVEWSAVEAWSRDASHPFAMHYTTQTDDAAFNQLIAEHDPRAAVVVAFSDTPVDVQPAVSALRGGPLAVLRAGTGLAAVTIAAEPSPPAIHRARGH